MVVSLRYGGVLWTAIDASGCVLPPLRTLRVRLRWRVLAIDAACGAISHRRPADQPRDPRWQTSAHSVNTPWFLVD